MERRKKKKKKERTHRISIDQVNADAVVEDGLEVGQDVREDEVARDAEADVDGLGARRRVVDVDAERVLRRRQVDVVGPVARGDLGVVLRAHVVRVAPRDLVVRPLHQAAADGRRLRARALPVHRRAVGRDAVVDAVSATLCFVIRG